MWSNIVGGNSLLEGIQNGTATLEDSLATYYESKYVLPNDLAISMVGIYPKGLKIYV